MKFLTGQDAPTPLTITTTSALPAPTQDWVQARNEIQEAARDALIFAQAKMSIYYDKKHKPLVLIPGQKAYIRLVSSMDTGYHLPNTISHKLSPQRVGPFEVLRAVGRLAYELKIPSTWKIHPMISIAYLEPYKDDTYGHTTETPVPDIITDDTNEYEEWEAEELVTKRYNKRRKRDEWLVKWKNFGPEHNTWEPSENLANATNLIEDFNREKNLLLVASTFFLPSTHLPPMANAFLATLSLTQ